MEPDLRVDERDVVSDWCHMTQAAENEQLRAGMADMAQGMDEFKKEMEEAGAGAAAEAAAKAQEDIDALRKQVMRASKM